MAYPAYLSHAASYIPAATVTASSSASAFPVANVKALPIAKPHRFTGKTSETYSIDLGSSKSVSLAAVIASNLSPGATVTVDNGVGVMTYRAREMFKLFAPVSAQNWTFTLADPGNAASFIQVGYIMLGLATQLAFGFQFGWRLRDHFENVRLESEYGVPHVTHLFERAEVELEFAPLLESEASTLRSFIRGLQGDVTPFLLIPDRDLNDAYFGRFAAPAFEQTIGLRRSVGITFLQDAVGKLAV